MPGKECRRPRCTSRGGWYLLDSGGEPGGLVTYKSHVFPYPLKLRPDLIAPIRMSAENQLATRREF